MLMKTVHQNLKSFEVNLIFISIVNNFVISLYFTRLPLPPPLIKGFECTSRENFVVLHKKLYFCIPLLHQDPQDIAYFQFSAYFFTSTRTTNNNNIHSNKIYISVHLPSATGTGQQSINS